MKIHRYWGKILGLQRNYYVLECEWRDEEIENKLWVNSTTYFNYFYQFET